MHFFRIYAPVRLEKTESLKYCMELINGYESNFNTIKEYNNLKDETELAAQLGDIPYTIVPESVWRLSMGHSNVRVYSPDGKYFVSGGEYSPEEGIYYPQPLNGSSKGMVCCPTGLVFDSQTEKMGALRKMANATIDAVIEVPGRAFFFLVVQEEKRLQKKALHIQYQAGQTLFKLMGYNRCRLFTISLEDEPKIIPEIDTALSWQGLFNAFSQARNQYAFTDHVLTFFQQAL